MRLAGLAGPSWSVFVAVFLTHLLGHILLPAVDGEVNGIWFSKAVALADVRY